MNHKPRTRLAALLLACLLLCPSPGRSEATVQTDVPVPQEAAIPAEETMEPQETVQEPVATPAEETAQEATPTEVPVLPTQEPCRSQPRLQRQKRSFQRRNQRNLLHKPRPKHRPIR